jgi:hypothetical protein
MSGTYNTFVASAPINARKHPEEERKDPNTPSLFVRCRKDETPFAACTASQWGVYCRLCQSFVCSTLERQRLAGGESLGDDALQRQLLLLQVLSGGILDLELSHGVR